MGKMITAVVNTAKTLVRREYDSGGIHWLFWCPACNETHLYNNRMRGGKPGWDWNGDMDSPTFTPSLRYLRGNCCHLFVTAGVISYCGDCKHGMAGKSVPLPPIPDAELDWIVPNTRGNVATVVEGKP